MTTFKFINMKISRETFMGYMNTVSHMTCYRVLKSIMQRTLKNGYAVKDHLGIICNEEEWMHVWQQIQ